MSGFNYVYCKSILDLRTTLMASNLKGFFFLTKMKTSKGNEINLQTELTTLEKKNLFSYENI